MRKISSLLKTITTCLFAFICVAYTFTITANATELEAAPEAQATTEVQSETEGSAVAIIEVQGYTINGGMIEAGKDITVNLTIHNTASSQSAQSILMTFGNSNGLLFPVYGNDNQIYVGNLSPNATKEVSIPLTIGDNFYGSAVELTCQFDYMTAGTRLNNSSTIVIPTSGGSTIGVKSIDVSTHAIVNGKSLLAFSYVNQSSSNITDAKLVVDGNVSNASKEIKLDTVYAGKSYNEDYYVIFNEPGNQTIGVSLQYTNPDGTQAVVDLGKFDVTVSKETEAEGANSGLANIIGLVGKAVSAITFIIAACAIIIYIKKR